MDYIINKELTLLELDNSMQSEGYNGSIYDLGFEYIFFEENGKILGNYAYFLNLNTSYVMVQL